MLELELGLGDGIAGVQTLLPAFGTLFLANMSKALLYICATLSRFTKERLKEKKESLQWKVNGLLYPKN